MSDADDHVNVDDGGCEPDSRPRRRQLGLTTRRRRCQFKINNFLDGHTDCRQRRRIDNSADIVVGTKIQSPGTR